MIKIDFITESSLKKAYERMFQVLEKGFYSLLFLCLPLAFFSCNNAILGSDFVKDDSNEIALRAFSKEHNALMGSLLADGENVVTNPAEMGRIIGEIEANVRDVMNVDEYMFPQTRVQAESATSDMLNSIDVDSFLPSIKGEGKC